MPGFFYPGWDAVKLHFQVGWAIRREEIRASQETPSAEVEDDMHYLRFGNIKSTDQILRLRYQELH